MVLGYKQKLPDGKPTLFKEKILDGRKIHSIREDAKNLWAINKIKQIQHVYGNRTPAREEFLSNKFFSWQSIKIMRTNIMGTAPDGTEHVVDSQQVVMVNGMIMLPEEVKQIAINDGFDSVEKFFEWFVDDFNGKIIHWTPLRYGNNRKD